MVAGHGGITASKSETRVPVNFRLDEGFELGGKLPAGVYFDIAEKRFRAQGCYKSKKWTLGLFDDPIEAGQTYLDFKKDPEKWLKDRNRICHKK